MASTEVAVIGTGWCGGIRAEALANSALVDALHICEIRPERLEEVRALTKPATATDDYQEIVANPAISVVYISTTPEQTHYPIARDCLKAGKNVLLEKPIALEFWEADELIDSFVAWATSKGELEKTRYDTLVNLTRMQRAAGSIAGNKETGN